jgi:hypothetical protein
VVQTPERFDANAVLGVFLWDSTAEDKAFREVDFEMSRWGDEKAATNGQFVVQPSDRPGNVVRFGLLPGRFELSYRWSPGRLIYRVTAKGGVGHEHRFREGVPEANRESVRVRWGMYDAEAPRNGKTQEVVVEKFEFLR